MNTTFCVSDLHMGDGGPRDNFAWASGGKREAEFNSFLDYVELRGGKLFILGDLFELWQSNISKVITHRMALLDRLASMGATYLLGNHDIDLKYFTTHGGLLLSHPLFIDLKFEHELNINGWRILLIHGHEQDKYCVDESPGIGRVSAIYAGLKEDRNGSPISKFKFGGATVETRSLGRWDRFSNFVAHCCGKPSHALEMRRKIVKTFHARNIHALIYGHTHEPGQFSYHGGGGYAPVPIFNLGTWAESVCTYAEIGTDGYVQLIDWKDGAPWANRDKLIVDRK
jgi:UDP-2,3-diacylglucosamine pyrophosphatase LpxH